MKIVITTKCPNCNSADKKLLLGIGVWENLPGSKKFECEDCQTDFLSFFGFINIVLMYGKFVRQKKKNKLVSITGKILKYVLVILFAYFLFHNADRIKRRVVKFIRGPQNNEMRYFIERTKEKNLTTSTDPEIIKQINELYHKAELQINENKFIQPQNDNAWETYIEILRIDSNWNFYAVEGLRLLKEEVNRINKEETLQKQKNKLQIERDKLVLDHLQETKRGIEEVEKKIHQHENTERYRMQTKLQETQQIQDKLDKEKALNKLIDDFWLTLDSSWEKIFSEQLHKERIVKPDVQKIFELKEVICDNLPLKNIEPLRFLSDLKRLSISKTGIVSLEPLKNSLQLEYLNCSHNNIPSLESLSNLEKLIELNCSNNPIELLNPIKNNTNMQKFNIANTKVTTLNRISGFRELKELDFSFTNVSSLADINSNKLEKLSMTKTGVTDLNLLAQQINLTYIDCSHTKINDLTPLQALSQLVYLDVSYTMIKTIRPLRELSQLEILKLSGTIVDNITFIERMTKLKELHCNSFYLSGLDSFEKLVNLEYVLVNRNTHTQIFEKTHPRVKVEKKF
jgi:hypothetical protein